MNESIFLDLDQSHKWTMMHHLYITECPEMDQATIESFGDECNNLDNYSIQMIHNLIALLFNAVPSLNEASFLNSGVTYF